MLLVDLYRLQRVGRARVVEGIAPDADFWNGLDVSPHAPLRADLDVQQAGMDVVVRGRVSGEFRLSCRRCLEPVVAGIDEELGLLYRSGVVGEDEAEDVVALPPPGQALDLAPQVREQVLLAVPRYVYCREDCRGLCPMCGVNLNESTCGCTVEDVDRRWAPLRQLRRDG